MATNIPVLKAQLHCDTILEHQLKPQDHKHHLTKNSITSRGYDVVLVLSIPRKFTCPLCQLLMRDPIQTYRGELSCRSCYIAALKTSSHICPIDGKDIAVNDNGESCFSDKATRRDILQLECYCPDKRNECQWIGKVKDLEGHTSLCEFKQTLCDLCHDVFLLKDKEQHMKRECKFSKASCEQWGNTLDTMPVKKHEVRCDMKPMKCPYDCGSLVVMEKLFEHINNCSKIKSGTLCPYAIVGCGFENTNPEELQDHMVTDAQSHAALTITLVTRLHETIEQLRQEIIREQTLQVEMTKKMEEQRRYHDSIAIKIEMIKEDLQKLQQEGVKLAQSCELSEARMKEDISQIDARLQKEEIQGIQRKVEEIESKYEDFEAKIKSARLGGNGSNETSISDEMIKVTEKIDQLQQDSAVLSANFSDLELKLQLFENTSYTGRQLWKVDNVIYRMNQAVIGKVTALHSAPCFREIGGYKFCCRLYLNGDGMGRGTHVSLFFVVMKSEHDALLQWPFNERVTFRLICPYNKEESLTESFIPDKNSSSFKRPTKDMNIAAGCPMFLRKDKLHQFIVDDVIYIECTVGD